MIFNVGSLTVIRVRPHPEQIGRSISYLSFYVDPDHAEVRLANAGPDSRPAGAPTVFEGIASIVRDEHYAAAAEAQRSAESGRQKWSLRTYAPAPPQTIEDWISDSGGQESLGLGSPQLFTEPG